MGRAFEIVDDVLFCGALTGLSAIHMPDDTELWRCGIGGYSPTVPAFNGKRLYFGGIGGRLYCVNAISGRKAWTVKASERMSMPPAILDDTVYFGCEHGSFHAVDLSTHKPIWE